MIKTRERQMPLRDSRVLGVRIDPLVVSLVLGVQVLAIVGCATTDEEPDPPPEQAPTDEPVSDEPVRPAGEKELEEAVGLMQKEKYGEALKILDSITTEDEEIAGQVLLNKGICLYKTDQTGGSKEVFEKVVKNPSRDGKHIAHNYLGIIARERGDFRRAEEHYEQAIALESSYAKAHLNLGILLDIYRGAWEAALEHYRTYQDLTDGEDQKVAQWLRDLEFRIGRN